LLLADGLAATHGGPIKSADSLKDIEFLDVTREQDRLVYEAEWGRYGSNYEERDKQKFLKDIVKQPDAFFIVAHSPHLIKRKNAFYAELMKNHYIIFAARDNWGYVVMNNGNLALIDSNGKEDLIQGSKSSSSGEAMQIIDKAWNTISALLNNISIFRLNKYGLIIYESALQGSEEEKTMVEKLVSIKNTRGEPKFEIIIVPSSDKTNIITQWGITGVKTAADFLKERNIKEKDIPGALNGQVVLVADALKNQMPIGVIADHTVDADTITRNLNPDKSGEKASSRDRNQKYVFVTALPDPVDVIRDGKPYKTSNAAFSDILSKLALYDKLAVELESLSYKERIAKILCNILDATDIAQFTTQIEAIKHAVDEIAKAA
jgi:hypothetical protein